MNAHEQQLCELLVAAAARFAARTGPIWSNYESGSVIASFVLECRDRIANGALAQDQKRKLWTIFAPTCDWDDVVGDVELGNAVFGLLDQLYRAEVFGTL